MSVSASLLEGSNQRLTRIQAESIGCATPQEDIAQCFLGCFQSFLAFAVANVLLPKAQGSQRLRCLQTASNDQLIATLQPSNALIVTFPADDLPGSQQSCIEHAFQNAVVFQGSRKLLRVRWCLLVLPACPR